MITALIVTCTSFHSKESSDQYYTVSLCLSRSVCLSLTHTHSLSLTHTLSQIPMLRSNCITKRRKNSAGNQQLKIRH